MWEFWGLPDATGEALVKVGDILLTGSCQQSQRAADRTQEASACSLKALASWCRTASCSQALSAWHIQ